MIELGEAMSEDDWNTQSLCPDWSCKQVFLHLLTAEHGFSNWSDLSKPPFDEIQTVAREWASEPGARLIERFVEITDRRRSQFEAMSEADFDAESWTAAGPGTYRRYMEIRVFDHWAHEQDLRVPLGRPGNHTGPATEMSLDEAHFALGYLVGKRAGAPDGSSVTIHVTPPVPRELHAVVDGRARVVPELTDPTAEVTVDFLTFMLLCCGRIDPNEPLADGRVQVAGDEDLARKVATSLAFTI